MARLGQRGIKAGAPSLYAIYDTFFKRANIRQRGNNCTGHYDAPWLAARVLKTRTKLTKIFSPMIKIRWTAGDQGEIVSKLVWTFF